MQMPEQPKNTGAGARNQERLNAAAHSTSCLSAITESDIQGPGAPGCVHACACVIVLTAACVYSSQSESCFISRCWLGASSMMACGSQHQEAGNVDTTTDRHRRALGQQESTDTLRPVAVTEQTQPDLHCMERSSPV